MNEDDQQACEHHQMQLEQRQREDEALLRHKLLLEQFRMDCSLWDAEMRGLNERIEQAMWRK